MMRSRWRGDPLADLLCTAIDSVRPVASPVLGESCAGRGGRTHLRMFGKRVNLVVAHCTLEVLCMLESARPPRLYVFAVMSVSGVRCCQDCCTAYDMIDSTCTSQARYCTRLPLDEQRQRLIAVRDLPADTSRHYVLHG